jgi:RNA methyltransferase, TrmH family
VKLQRHTGRRRAGRFLAEGPNLVEAAGRCGLVEEVFATDAAGRRYRDLLAGLQVYPVTERAAKALSETVTPSGLVGVCRVPAADLDKVLADGPALVVVAVDLSEPGNAGTLIRLADAMGAAAVVFAGHSVDPYNGKCLRSSAGSIFALPIVVEPDTDRIISRLRAAGLQILATTLDGELSLDDADALLAAPTAWVLGPESGGLSTELAGMADHRVRIPMPGHAESLNVASAAAICLYQTARAHRLG